MILDLIRYLTMLFIVSFVFNMSVKFKDKSKIKYNLLFYFSLMIVTLFIGLRYNVGTDFESYTKIYYKIINLNLTSYFDYNIEIGHYIICKIANILFDNSYGMMIIYAFFTNFFVMKAIEKLTNKKYWLSYLIYGLTFLPFACNGIRQGLSMAIILYAFTFFNENKYIKFYLFILIAFLFHKSSIIIVPYSLIGMVFKNKDREYRYYILITLLIMALLFSESIFNFSIFNEYISYLNYKSTAGILKAFYKFPPVIFALYSLIYKSNDEQKINEHFLAVFVIIGYLLMLIGFKLNYVDRVSLYFEQFVIFLIPNIIYKSKYKFNKFAILIFSLIYYLILFYINIYIHGYYDFFPYNFISFK